ncbi:hypothetical protein [Sphingomonas sp. TDK1]|uniref:hypothetical protein n=1 Tax=Sphingomonas sp. TDK1 TaxID=453247 RepID=UPI0007DA0C08|nr:hypothetical protein [Sphingomonas sp. TDK1]OAN59572.1 hypothetical protein A7X12_24540 [Sphingomonas sp. TDK1]
MREGIEEGFMAFVSDGSEGIGAVRLVRPDALVIYVENAGEFVVPLTAVRDVYAQKVILECRKLPHDIRKAIGHAHDVEDTAFVRHPPTP